MAASAQRSLYPEGVEIHQNDLAFERDTRIFEHIQRSLDEAAMGVQSGFGVTVNGADATKIDVAAGTGYAPDGNYVVLSPGQSAITLASSVLGVVNFVLAIYTENETDPQPHETGTNSPDTHANRSVRIRVYTAAGYAALLTTDPNLANDAQDRALVLARVTATGGALTAGSIASPTAFNTINYSSQPINVTGVTITGVSSNTASGTGTLAFTFVGTLLTWTPPGGSAGAGVNVGGGGSFTLFGGGGSPPSITVEVISASLPGSNQSDSITITALYNQTIARFTSEDWLHRSLLGTGTPTPTNPHGLRISDLGGVELEELETHQDIQHSNGIWRGSSGTALAVAIDATTAPDRLVVTAPAGVDTYYVNGRRLTSILSTIVTFTTAPVAAVLYEVLIDNTTAISVSARATWPTAPARMTGVEMIDMSDGTTAGAKNLAYVFPAQTLAWDLGPTVAVAAGGWFRLVAANDRDYIDVFVITADLPGASQTDSITVATVASADAFMRIAMVCWTGSATGFLGYTPSRGVTTERALDKRFYGTTEEFNFHDEDSRYFIFGDGTAAQVIRRTVHERNLDELRVSGVLVGYNQIGSIPEDNSLKVTSAGGLNVNVAGGISYIFGERIERGEQTGVALTDNATNWLYLDLNGVLQASTSISTLLQIIGDGSANQPGRGIALAKVVTAAGAITSLLDYRRNIFRLDNIVGSLTVGRSEAGARNRAQFFSLQAAVDYATTLGIRALHITSLVSESVITTMTLTTPLRITCDPDVTVTLSGAAVKFTIGSNGALEWIGGDLAITGERFISYGGNTASWVLIRDAEITVSAGLFTNTTSVADEKGFRMEGCNVDLGAAGSTMILMAEGWSSTSQIVFENCFFDVGTDSFYSDSAIAGAETIANLHVHDCDIECGVAFNGTIDATWNDWIIRNNRFLVTGRFIRVNNATARLLVEGNDIERATTATLGCILFAGSASFLHLNTRILHNTFQTQAGPTSGYFDSGFAAAQAGLKIIGNNFGAVGGVTDPTIWIHPVGAPTSDDIEISDNSISAGQIQIGAAAGDAIRLVEISNNVIDEVAGASTTAGIWLAQSITEWVISGNVISYGTSTIGGILIENSSGHGTISGNTLTTDNTTNAHVGIIASSPDVVITGNYLTIEGAGTTLRTAILTSGGNCVISNNHIETEQDNVLAAAIDVSGASTVVSGNEIQFVVSDSDSIGIRIQAFGCTVTGNVVDAGDTTQVQALVVTTQGVAITGNRFPRTDVATDEVDLGAGTGCTYAGNIIRNSAGVNGTAALGAAVTAANIP